MSSQLLEVIFFGYLQFQMSGEGVLFL